MVPERRVWRDGKHGGMGGTERGGNIGVEVTEEL